MGPTKSRLFFRNEAGINGGDVRYEANGDVVIRNATLYLAPGSSVGVAAVSEDTQDGPPVIEWRDLDGYVNGAKYASVYAWGDRWSGSVRDYSRTDGFYHYYLPNRLTQEEVRELCEKEWSKVLTFDPRPKATIWRKFRYSGFGCWLRKLGARSAAKE